MKSQIREKLQAMSNGPKRDIHPDFEMKDAILFEIIKPRPLGLGSLLV